MGLPFRHYIRHLTSKEWGLGEPWFNIKTRKTATRRSTKLGKIRARYSVEFGDYVGFGERTSDLESCDDTGLGFLIVANQTFHEYSGAFELVPRDCSLYWRVSSKSHCCQGQ